MKDKIFQALKQAFPQLGLGDEILQARAEALDATGLVNEENLQSVVASQKANLEALQKSNDKRVAEALAKAKKDADAAAEKLKADHAAALKAEQEKLTAAQKKLEELEKRGGGGGGQLSQEAQAQIDALKTAYDEQLKGINETIKSLQTTNSDYAAKLKAMQDEKDAAAKAAAAKARLDMINAKAKEAGIPEWRINQGFSFADDMDETKITETLNGYAAEIKKQLLPTDTRFAHQGNDQEVTKEQASDIVKGILRK